jgi:hypothetical protein
MPGAAVLRSQPPPEPKTVKQLRLHPSARPARRLTALPVLAAAFALGACGGGDGPTENRSSTAARLNVATQSTVASTTTGATVRVVPVYEQASGARVALGTQTAPLNGSAALDIELKPCFDDGQRRGASEGTGTSAVCYLGAAVTLRAADGRTLDSVAVAPVAVRGGTTTSATVSFVEITGVTITNGGTAVGANPVPLQDGQSVTFGTTAQGANGAAVNRTAGWTSNDPTIARVDPVTGVVTGVGFGTAAITAVVGGRTTTASVLVRPALTVNKAGTGQGSVTSSPAGITCTASAVTCTTFFTPGTVVTLTAAGDANSAFTGWSGACTGTANCTVTLDQSRTVAATFTPRANVTLTVNVAGPGAGTVQVTGTGVSNGICTLAAGQASTSCAVTAETGRTVTLTATPASGSAAGTWTGACSGSTATACTVNVTAAATVGASFTVGAPVTLDTVFVSIFPSNAGAAYQAVFNFTGTLRGQSLPVIPVRLSTTNAQPSFFFEVDRGTSVTIRVTPDAPAARVTAWGDACATVGTLGTTGECTITSQPRSQVSVTVGP